MIELLIESPMVCIICAIFILVFGVCTQSVMRMEARNIKNWEEIQAWCIRIEKNQRFWRSRRYQPRFYAYMRYFIDGQEHNACIDVFNELQVGKSYPMIRHRKNGRMQLASDIKHAETFGGFGTVCVCVASAMIIISVVRMVIAGHVF
ncbi:MAG: hypothetical protein IJZ68_08835 [Bacteroidaceae bacterium]|nr:hypothetical protein [Bacteroidaceae bacterium]